MCPLSSYVQLDFLSATQPRKINLPKNQEGYEHFETTVGNVSKRRIQLTVVTIPKNWKFGIFNFFKNESEACYHIQFYAFFRGDHRCGLGFFVSRSDFWQIDFVYTAAEIDSQNYFTQN